LHANLFTPSEDLWVFDSSGSNLTYGLISKQINIENMVKVSRIIDNNNQIHLFIIDISLQAFHLIWDNQVWRKSILPFSKWDQLITYVDSCNRLYILVKESCNFNLLIWDEGQYTVSNLFIPKSDSISPLYFSVDNSNVLLYLVDSEGGTVTANVVSRLTGKLQSYYTLIEDYDYKILKQWVVDGLLIMVMQERASEKRIRIITTDLNTNESRLNQYDSLDLGKITSYHLLIDKSVIILLASCYRFFYYIFSFNRGKEWTSAQKSTLFTPLILSDINSINHSPTSFICLKQVHGQNLQYPLVLSLTDISRLVRNSKVVYEDPSFKSRKKQSL